MMANRRSEAQIDAAVEGSFPASDPPSFNPGVARAGRRQMPAPTRPKKAAKARHEHLPDEPDKKGDREVDEAGYESFPASDPPSFTPGKV